MADEALFTVSVELEHLDGPVTDADVMQFQNEVQRILSLAWGNGDFNMGDVVLGEPVIWSDLG